MGAEVKISNFPVYIGVAAQCTAGSSQFLIESPNCLKVDLTSKLDLNSESELHRKVKVNSTMKVNLTSKLELHSAVVVSRFLQSQVPAIIIFAIIIFNYCNICNYDICNYDICSPRYLPHTNIKYYSQYFSLFVYYFLQSQKIK